MKGCHGISEVISSNMVQILQSLEQLEVKRCNSLNDVIIQAERLAREELHGETVLARLTRIYLQDLPMLMHLSGSGPCLQSLQILRINGCKS